MKLSMGEPGGAKPESGKKGSARAFLCQKDDVRIS
jgi:hypothetical protein